MGRPATATTTAKATKPAAAKKAEASHPTYRDMIADAISTLKERNGSSRQAIKKYIQSNFKDLKNFDTQFNAALRRGVEKGDFVQPKGPSGTVKLNIHKKKEAAAKAKAAAAPKADAAEKPKKATAAKKADKEAKPKKAAAAKKETTKKETAKKETKPKEKAAAKPKEKTEKANAAKKVKKAPATKSGRVSKGTAAAPKKTAAKKKAAVVSKKAAAAAAAAPAAEA